VDTTNPSRGSPSAVCEIKRSVIVSETFATETESLMESPIGGKEESIEITYQGKFL
jgi:hypothetical protein